MRFIHVWIFHFRNVIWFTFYWFIESYSFTYSYMISLFFVQFGRNCWVGTIAYTVHCDVVMIDWWCIKGRSAILIMMVPGRKIKSAEVEQVVVPRAFSNAAKFRSSLAWKLKYTTITDCDICRLLSSPNAPQLSLKHTEWQENVGFFF